MYICIYAYIYIYVYIHTYTDQHAPAHTFKLNTDLLTTSRDRHSRCYSCRPTLQTHTL